jgi:hypothetical protein
MPVETWWTQERVEALRRLWDEDLAAVEIGRRIGATKNAVIGKANRLGLQPREANIGRWRDYPRRSCEASDCDRKQISRGFCQMHYARWHRKQKRGERNVGSGHLETSVDAASGRAREI